MEHGGTDNIPTFPMHSFGPETIGALVRQWRADSEWSQEQLAEISGLAVKTVQRVEKGRPGSRDTLRALARAFAFFDIKFFERSRPQPTSDQLKTLCGGSADVDRSVDTQTSGRTALVKVKNGLQYDPDFHANAAIGTTAHVNDNAYVLWDSACLAGWTPVEGSRGGGMKIRRDLSAGILRDDELSAFNEKLLERFRQIGLA